MKALNIDFMGQRKIAAIVSVVLLLVSLGSLATRGLSFGLDFTGGALVEVTYEQAADLNATRQVLEDAGFEDSGGAELWYRSRGLDSPAAGQQPDAGRSNCRGASGCRAAGDAATQ